MIQQEFRTTSRADQILAHFIKFHRENPKVWILFQKFAHQVIAAGKAHYSSDCVCHRIRWHTQVETQGEDVKINDNYTAYYARLFHLAYPQHEGFFQIRKLISQRKMAYITDETVYPSEGSSNEENIDLQLRKLL